jgi:hypothetical protein
MKYCQFDDNLRKVHRLFFYIYSCVWERERERERERYVIVYVIFIKSVAKQGLSCDSSCDTYLYKNKNCYRDL